MAAQITDEQRERYQQAFAMFDVGGRGYITRNDLKKAMKKVGKILSDQEVKNVLQKVDTDGDGKIDMNEFITMMAKATKRTESEIHMRESFKVFDVNGDGFISKAELRQVMANLGEELTDEDVQDMVKEADIDGDGQINYEEFVSMMFGK